MDSRILMRTSIRRSTIRLSEEETPVPMLCGHLIRRLLVVLALFCILARSSLGFGAAISLTEYQIKSFLLLNCAKYVEWPAGAFVDSNSPLLIAVLGDWNVSQEIQNDIMGRTVNGRPIILKRPVSGQDIGVCHILFISATKRLDSPRILAALREGVLTVAEHDDFLETGGIINLAHRDHKIVLEVNLIAAERAHIKLSSNLLRLASVVKGKPK